MADKHRGRPHRTGRTRAGTRPPGVNTRPPGAGADLLYGLNPVRAALEANRRRMTAVVLRDGRPSPKLKELRILAARRALPIEEHRPGDLEALCGSPNHQGAVLRCGPLPLLAEAGALGLPAAPPTEGAPAPLLVALDQVEDPRNLGAIVRSVAAFGAAGLVLPRDHSAPLSAAASSASAGTLERLPVYQAANLARFLSAAKKRGFWVAGAEAEGGPPLESFRHEGPLILLLGSEGQGLRPLVRRQCDFLLTIPLPGGGAEPGSLNVSAAAAVLLYRLTRREDVPATP